MKHTKSDIPVAFDDHGQGEPVLLCLPGWCVDRSAFEDLVQVCSHDRRTLSLDWRGHGQSAPAHGDFGEAALIDDALTVIQESGARQIVPVALSHAGWVAIELRRRLGGRVPAIVLVDWLVLDPPPPFSGMLSALQDSDKWQSARDQLFAMWLHGVDNHRVIRLVQKVMGSYGFDMWARAGRTIEAAYRREGYPLKALAELRPTVPVLHLYSQSADSAFHEAQEMFAEANRWFSVRKLNARSHFPILEIPEYMAGVIESFIAQI